MREARTVPSGTGLPGSRSGAPAVVSSGADDGRLMALVASGDADAFRQIVARHLPKVVAVARRMLGSAADADDVAQEALLRLWRHAERVEVGPNGLGAWLYRVTTNLALDRIRGRRQEDPDALETMSVAGDQERSLEQADLARRVEQELQALPERQRAALVLCHYEGLSMTAAGGILGVSEEAIESLLARGRRALRAALADEWRQLLPAGSDGGSG